LYSTKQAVFTEQNISISKSWVS